MPEARSPQPPASPVFVAGVERPTGWVRSGILVGAVGYSLSAVVALATGWHDGPRNLATSAVLWFALWLARRRPRLSSYLVVSVITLELLYSTYEAENLLGAWVLVFPLMTLVAGLLLGGDAALAVGIFDAVAMPLAFLAGGRWSPGLSRMTVEDKVNLTAYLIIVIGTAVITRAGLRTYQQVLDSSERVRRRYVDLFEHAPDGMVALGSGGAITELNQMAARLLGKESAALIGQDLEQALREAGAAARIELRSARQGAPLSLELVPPGAPHRSLEIQAREDPAGAAGAQLLVLRDVTGRRALEEQLGHAQRMESVGQLAGGVAHDFNNLLTAVGGNAALLLEHGDAEVRELAGEIQQAQQRGSALTQQLLAFARRELRKAEAVDLGETAAQMRRLLERILGERHPLELVHCGPAAVFADRTQLEQTLLNLVTNARDAMPEGGPVRVEVRRLAEAEAAAFGSKLAGVAQQVMLEVLDRGGGMSAEVRERIFEPFFTTKPRGKGTGLGLATVHGIVLQSGGSVAVESAPGAGCRLRVFFPAVEGLSSRPSATTPGAAAPGGREHVLVVEDNPQVRALVTRILSKAGYTVSVAADGEAALALLGPRPHFDLLLTDIVMPGLTGPQLAKRIQQQHPALPVVFMSGYYEEGHDVPEGLEPDRNLLRKPFEPEQLLRIVRSALGPPRKSITLTRQQVRLAQQRPQPAPGDPALELERDPALPADVGRRVEALVAVDQQPLPRRLGEDGEAPITFVLLEDRERRAPHLPGRVSVGDRLGDIRELQTEGADLLQ